MDVFMVLLYGAAEEIHVKQMKSAMEEALQELNAEQHSAAVR